MNQDYTWVNAIEKKRIKQFHNYVLKFCVDHNMAPSFYNFLNYNSSGYVSETYSSLFTANRFYLVNSKAFSEYYNRLDVDFRNDIMSYAEYKQLKYELMANNELLKYLKFLMGEDSLM